MSNTPEDRLRNKIRALEIQNKAFEKRLAAFSRASLWARLRMAWRGSV